MQTLNRTVVAAGRVFAQGTTRDAAPGVPDGAWWDGEPAAAPAPAGNGDGGPFDPAEHNQDKVVAYLDAEDTTDEERDRVLGAEATREGGTRQKIAKWAEAREAARKAAAEGSGDE